MMPQLPQNYHFDFNPEGNLHPFLQEFKSVPNSGLNTAAILSYWQIELPANSTANRVLDYTADEGKARDPAITEHTVGKGRVVFNRTLETPMKVRFVVGLGRKPPESRFRIWTRKWRGAPSSGENAIASR
jgi:hypothetical protein